jgi:hypothetical protein
VIGARTLVADDSVNDVGRIRGRFAQALETESRRSTMFAIMRSDRARPTFTAELSGDVVATIHGEATFSRAARPGAGPVLDLGLGLLGVQGAVLFTLTTDRRPGPGGHPILEHWNGYDHIRARVVLGPLERPLAELRARSGKLTIVSASDSRIAGRFVLSAIGERSREPLRLIVRGRFAARAA